MRFILIMPFVLFLPGVAISVAVLDGDPIVFARETATPEDAQRAKRIARKVYRLTETGQIGRIVVTEPELNSIGRFAQRAIPGLMTEARISDGIASAYVSVPAPFGRWVNMVAELVPSSPGIRLETLKVGALDLPAQATLGLFVSAIDLLIGDRAGSRILEGLSSVAVTGNRIVADIDISREDRRRLTQQVRAEARQIAGLGSPDHVHAYWTMIKDAQETGSLRQDGSFTEYLRFALAIAAERQGHTMGHLSDKPGEVHAALIALAIQCGDIKVQQLVGEIVPSAAVPSTRQCDRVVLAGRRDLRKHFIISAALTAASSTNVAVTIGELKELLDVNKGGSGFSFDDIAADLAGVHFANRVLAMSAIDLKKLKTTLRRESDFFPRIADLPKSLTEQEFKVVFGDIDSVRYQAMVQRIETRIGGLPMFAMR